VFFAVCDLCGRTYLQHEVLATTRFGEIRWLTSFARNPISGTLHGKPDMTTATRTITTSKTTIIRFAWINKRNSTEALYQLVPNGKRRNRAQITANR
jgi:hypothetical protein